MKTYFHELLLLILEFIGSSNRARVTGMTGDIDVVVNKALINYENS